MEINYGSLLSEHSNIEVGFVQQVNHSDDIIGFYSFSERCFIDGETYPFNTVALFTVKPKA